MSGPDIEELRNRRNVARTTVDAGLSQVKADLSARSIPGRMADKARDDAFDLADQAIDVAKESKGIIAGAVAALALWALREPALALVQRLIRPAPVQDEDARPGDEN